MGEANVGVEETMNCTGSMGETNVGVDPERVVGKVYPTLES